MRITKVRIARRGFVPAMTEEVADQGQVFASHDGLTGSHVSAKVVQPQSHEPGISADRPPARNETVRSGFPRIAGTCMRRAAARLATSRSAPARPLPASQIAARKRVVCGAAVRFRNDDGCTSNGKLGLSRQGTRDEPTGRQEPCKLKTKKSGRRRIPTTRHRRKCEEHRESTRALILIPLRKDNAFGWFFA